MNVFFYNYSHESYESVIIRNSLFTFQTLNFAQAKKERAKQYVLFRFMLSSE